MSRVSCRLVLSWALLSCLVLPLNNRPVQSHPASRPATTPTVPLPIAIETRTRAIQTPLSRPQTPKTKTNPQSKTPATAHSAQRTAAQPKAKRSEAKRLFQSSEHIHGYPLPALHSAPLHSTTHCAWKPKDNEERGARFSAGRGSSASADTRACWQAILAVRTDTDGWTDERGYATG